MFYDIKKAYMEEEGKLENRQKEIFARQHGGYRNGSKKGRRFQYLH